MYIQKYKNAVCRLTRIGNNRIGNKIYKCTNRCIRNQIFTYLKGKMHHTVQLITFVFPQFLLHFSAKIVKIITISYIGKKISKRLVNN